MPRNTLRIGAIAAAAAFVSLGEASAGTCTCNPGVAKPGGGFILLGPSLASNSSVANSAACTSLCLGASTGFAQSKAQTQTQLCSDTGIPKQPGMSVKLIAKFDNAVSDTGTTLASLIYVPPSYTQSCACSGGYAYDPATPGGANKCSKEAGSITATSGPSDGTMIGSWGFVRGGKIYAIGEAPTCTNTKTSDGTCKFQ